MMRGQLMKKIIAGVMAVAFVATGVLIYAEWAWGATASGSPGVSTKKIRILSQPKVKPAAEKSRPAVRARSAECPEHYTYLPQGSTGSGCYHYVQSKAVEGPYADYWTTVDGVIPDRIYGGHTCRFDFDYPPASVCPSGTEIRRIHAVHYGCRGPCPEEQRVCTDGFDLIGSPVIGRTSEGEAVLLHRFICAKSDLLGTWLIIDRYGSPEIYGDHGSLDEYIGEGNVSNTYDKSVCGRGTVLLKRRHGPNNSDFCCVHTKPPAVKGKLAPRRIK
jgi:hypothetical protein